jgi:DNA-directed RNA polymerase subunit H (RpoH/RPB5)
MSYVHKINKSRSLFKKFLESEWDVSVISDYSDEEIEKLYNLKNSKNPLSFGKAGNLNITLEHSQIKDHKLHIIYYNFPEINSPPLKVTKQCADKINKLYLEESIQPEDSVILIITEKISENLEKAVEDLYKFGQEQLKINGLSDNIIDENEKLKENKYRMDYFRNIHLFCINNISFDISVNITVPEHVCIRDEEEINKILKKVNATRDQMPIILRTDPMAKLIRLCPGDICDITRRSERCGEYKYYRICK